MSSPRRPDEPEARPKGGRRPEGHDEIVAPRAGPYVVAKLRVLDTVLIDTMPRLVGKQAKGALDDEAIHDLRVAIRRMRTLLKISRSLFGRWHVEVVRNAFADVMRATGALRDEEVLEETLAAVAANPELAGWIRERKPREVRLRRAVTQRIERGDLDRARLMLKALLVFPVAPERNVELARFARRAVERARRKVERRRDVRSSDALGLHNLRIAYKELRYTIELLSDALPLDARAQLEPAIVFQKRLGELHDVDVAVDVLQHAKGLSTVAREEALTAIRQVRTAKLTRYLHEVDPIGWHSAAGEDAPPRNQVGKANGQNAELSSPEGEPSGQANGASARPAASGRPRKASQLPLQKR